MKVEDSGLRKVRVFSVYSVFSVVKDFKYE